MKAIPGSYWKPLASFFGASFILHLLWENLQAPLYAGYVSFDGHAWVCLRATFGDMLIMLLMYVALAAAHRDLLWVKKRDAYARPATWLLPVAIGMIIAVGIEWWSVYGIHRWSYGTMPLIPVLGVGVSPVLQMMIIPAVAAGFSARFASS